MNRLIAAALFILQAVSQNTGNGVVEGRVLATDGRTPAASVRVTAMPASVDNGPGLALHVSIAETDRDGRYRLENIPAGHYYISAGLVTSPTYFPGTTSLSTASAIQVQSSAVIRDVNFSMRAPARVKVSGRLVVPPSPRATPATVVLQNPGTFVSLETTINSDGTFAFEQVPPGIYTLQNFLGLPPMAVAVADKDVTDLLLGGNTTGVRVRGSVIGPGVTSIAMSPFRLAPSTLLNAHPDRDGTFEFLQVPPGTYLLGVTPSPARMTALRLEVGDKPIEGVEIKVPFNTDVMGRVILDDGTPFQQPGMVVEASTTTMGSASPVQADGSFRVRVSEGDYRLHLRLPLGYSVKSIRNGAQDLATEPLRIVSGMTYDNVVFTLVKVGNESIEGVRVSGQLIGLTGASRVRLLLTPDVQGFVIETTPNADGTFEFLKVPSGNYTYRLTGLEFANVAFRDSRLFVGTDDIRGLEIPVDVQTLARGRISVLDAAGTVMPTVFPAGVIVSFKSTNAFTATSPQTGTFAAYLREGEHRISIDGLPGGFTVKSVTSSTHDLLKGPLTIQTGLPAPAVEVYLEYRP